MSDPLSIAAGAAGLVSLGLTVCSGLFEYYNVWKDQHSDISAMCESLEGLSSIFELLDEKIRHPLLDRKSVDKVTESIISCAAGIQGLQSKLKKISSAKTGMAFEVVCLDLLFWFKLYRKLKSGGEILQAFPSVECQELELSWFIRLGH